MEKIKKVFICVTIICLLLCSCASRNASNTDNGADGQILEYQRKIDSLENELSLRDRAVADAINEIDAIAARSGDVEKNIDNIIREFDEYQRAVERLLYNYQNATRQDYTAEENTLEFDRHTDY